MGSPLAPSETGKATTERLVAFARILDRCIVLGRNTHCDSRLGGTMKRLPISPLRQQYGAEAITVFHDEYLVILLDDDSSDGLMLRSQLQAVGAQVHSGPHAADPNSSALIVVQAKHRYRANIMARLKSARQVFPEAPVCFVTGHVLTPPLFQTYHDARAVLQAAGIPFVAAS